MDSFVSLATFNQLYQAQVVLAELQECGIHAFLSGELASNTFGDNFALGSQVRLQVAQCDLKRARDILIWLEGNSMPDGWEMEIPVESGFWICSKCEEAVEEDLFLCPWCGAQQNDVAPGPEG